MQRDSVEYLKFWLVDRDQQDIHADTVQVALTARGAATGSFLPCTFISTGTDPEQGRPCTFWRTTSVITWSTASYPLNQYQAEAQVGDTPETPRVSLGTVVIQ